MGEIQKTTIRDELRGPREARTIVRYIDIQTVFVEETQPQADTIIELPGDATVEPMQNQPNSGDTAHFARG